MKDETIAIHAGYETDPTTKAEVTPDMIRLCIGIEHIDDILEDLDQALAASG